MANIFNIRARDKETEEPIKIRVEWLTTAEHLVETLEEDDKYEQISYAQEF